MRGFLNPLQVDKTSQDATVVAPKSVGQGDVARNEKPIFPVIESRTILKNFDPDLVGDLVLTHSLCPTLRYD